MIISIVVPAFNEAVSLPALCERIGVARAPYSYEIVIVDDGSTDDTVHAVSDLRITNDTIKIVRLQKNCGHQIALRAGLREAKGDICITLDADLQHPPEKIPEMIAAYEKGFDVVVMVHTDRQLGFLKEFWSRLFYTIFSKLTGTKLYRHESDFRLLSRRVVDVINKLPERNVFIRGLLPILGFPLCRLSYTLGKRNAGSSGYSFSKSLTLALEAIFSFSTMPIRILFGLGFSIAALSFVYGLVNIYFKIFTTVNVPGFTDIIASVLFLGGLNLVMLSVIAKYLQIVVDHVKQRPEYLIDQSLLSDSSRLISHAVPDCRD